MKTIILVILMTILSYAQDSDTNDKLIDVTRGGDNSAWKRYQNTNYSVRDKVIARLKIKKKQGFLHLKFWIKPFAVDVKKAKKLNIKPYYITHITVNTEKRVLLDSSISDLNQKFGGWMYLKLLHNQGEKSVTIKVTDSNDYTTEYYSDISNYRSKEGNSTSIYNKIEYKEMVDYRTKYPKAWKATNITSAVEILYGKNMAKKVQKLYKGMNKNSFNFLADGALGVRVDITTDKKYSSFAIFSTTTDKKRVLVSIIDIPDRDVILKNAKTFIPVPVRRDGEILVVAKDREDVLHISKLYHIRAVTSTEEEVILKVELD